MKTEVWIWELGISILATELFLFMVLSENLFLHSLELVNNGIFSSIKGTTDPGVSRLCVDVGGILSHFGHSHLGGLSQNGLLVCVEFLVLVCLVRLLCFGAASINIRIN